MRYVSLFAGIGGFDLALNRLGHTCVWANEWDKYATKIYNRNFGRKSTGDTLQINGSLENWKQESVWEGTRGDNLQQPWDRTDSNVRGEQSVQESGCGILHGVCCDTRDIRTVPTSEIPDHDLLVGGFPCQAFSIAGKRKGFDDTRGTLFFEIARILADKRPRYFILENVKGLLSHDNGKTFATILGVLTDLGYDFQWQVLNSKNFGVPQNRERVFIVGHLRGEPRPEVFPITVSSGTNSELVYAQKADREIARVYDTKGIAPTLHLKTGGWQEPKIQLPTNTKKGYAEATEGDGINLSFPNSKTRRGRVIKGVSPTLQAVSGSIGTLDKMKIRRLTPKECERLQGFPDGWTEGVSDTQRYKCLGNAVTVNVVYEVARRLE